MDEAEAEVTEAGDQSARPAAPALRFGLRHAPAGAGDPALSRRAIPVSLDITISDQPLGAMMRRAVDLAIRIGPLDESSLVARRICNLERVICAAPAYLERHGTPRTPDDLQQHNCLWITSLPALRRWPFDTDDGIRVVHVDGNVVANNAETVLQLAVAGVGITRLTDVIVGDAIRAANWCPSSPTGTTSSRCRCMRPTRAGATCRPRCAPWWISWSSSLARRRGAVCSAPDPRRPDVSRPR
jgi:DNA-binding transcriptional LysR family regulator